MQSYQNYYDYHCHAEMISVMIYLKCNQTQKRSHLLDINFNFCVKTADFPPGCIILHLEFGLEMSILFDTLPKTCIFGYENWKRKHNFSTNSMTNAWSLWNSFPWKMSCVNFVNCKFFRNQFPLSHPLKHMQIYTYMCDMDHIVWPTNLCLNITLTLTQSHNIYAHLLYGL